MDKMVDHSCDEKTEEQLRACVLQNPDVARIDLLQTRIFGNKIYADIEIEVDGSMPLREAHKIAEVVHNSIEKTFPKVKHIMVHVNPEKSTGDRKKDCRRLAYFLLTTLCKNSPILSRW